MGNHQLAIDRLKALGLGSHWNNITIVAEALRRGIEVNRKNGTRSLLLTHDGKTHTWHRGRTSYNSLITRRIADDKVLTSRYLQSRGFRVAENCLFRAGQAERAWDWGEPLGPLVVKPFNGIKGRNVHVNIRDKGQFVEAFDSVGRAHEQILVEEYSTGDERRFLVVDNKLVGAMNRRPPSVLGDGVHSVQELVSKKNHNRNPPHYPLKIDEVAEQALASQRMRLDSVPTNGERVYIRDVINIHAGGDPVDITDDVTDAQRQTAEAAAASIPGLRLVGFDVFLKSSDSHNSMVFIEMNANPDITMHEHPVEGQFRHTSGAILDGMFPSTRS